MPAFCKTKHGTGVCRGSGQPTCAMMSRAFESNSAMRDRLGSMLNSVCSHSYLQGRVGGVLQGTPAAAW